MAARLGNTRAIARSSYVSPRVINHYMEGSVISYYSERIEEVIVAEQGGLTEGEKALLESLQRKLSATGEGRLKEREAPAEREDHTKAP